MTEQNFTNSVWALGNSNQEVSVDSSEDTSVPDSVVYEVPAPITPYFLPSGLPVKTLYVVKPADSQKGLPLSTLFISTKSQNQMVTGVELREYHWVFKEGNQGTVRELLPVISKFFLENEVLDAKYPCLDLLDLFIKP